MHKFLTTISIAFLFFSFIPKQINAQVVTEIDSILICYDAITGMPVVVQNMNAVDSLKLVLTFDNNSINYVEYFAVNSKLSGGNFDVTDENGSIIISWQRTNSATIAHDTLVWLNFKGLSGSTILHWDTISSYYHTATGNTFAIFDNGKVVVNPKINVILTEINPTCTSKLNCVANYQAQASGGTPPYKYWWNGKLSQWDFTQKYLCSGLNNITVTDSYGCKLDSNYIINGLPGANVKLIIEGNEDTTIYLQNPVLTFSFEEVPPTHVVEPPYWEFGDGDTAVSFNPTHVYSKANTATDDFYTLKLHIVNENGCDTTIQVDIPIKEAKLKIPGVITPNGDGLNEAFMILNENKTGSGEEIKITNEFQRMELVIFDRWGRKIYDDSNYQSDWIAKGVPDGSYFFKLKTIGYYRTDNYKGSITILGSGITN